MTLKEKAIQYQEGKRLSHVKEISCYNHNYYIGELGDLIFAKSDDDDRTDYYVVNTSDMDFDYIGYSITSDGDKFICDV